MLKSEWKKMLFHRYGFLVIALYLLIHGVTLLFFRDPYYLNIEQNRSTYDSYMEKLEGALTEEKEAFIKEENNRILKLKNELDDMRWDYLYGKISEEEYRSQREALLSIHSVDTAFQEIYNQYIHVRENPENRFFLSINGWESLLSNQRVDYVLLFAMIILLVPMFCEEYRSSMNELLMTQKKSAVNQVFCKAVVAVATMVFLTLTSILMEYVYYKLCYGLPHGDYTLQSLTYYGNTQKILSLNQAFLLVVICKLFGYAGFAIILLFLSSTLKKYGAALTVGTAITLLPFLFVKNMQSFASIPVPWGYVVGTIYLMPAKYERSQYTGERELLFSEMSWKNMIVVFFLTLVFLSLLLFAVWYQNKNHWLNHRKRFPRNITTAAFFLTILIGSSCILSGCQAQDTSQSILFNSATYKDYETEQYLFYFLGDTLYCQDKQTGEVNEALRDAQGDYYSVPGNCLFGAGNQLYYLRATNTYDELIEPGKGDVLSVFALNTDTFEESMVYEERMEYANNFLDINMLNMEEIVNLVFTSMGGNQIFVDDSNIYLVGGANGNIYQINRITKNMKSIIELPIAADVAFDGNYIYYPDDFYGVVRYNTATGKEESISGVVAKNFLLAKEGLYYINVRDHNCIYLYDFSKEEAKKIGDISADAIWCDSAHIYYIDEKEQMLYRMDKAGNEVSLVYEGNPFYVHLFDDSAFLYLELVNTQISIDKETLEQSTIDLENLT